jgi:hypothetical protein
LVFLIPPSIERLLLFLISKHNMLLLEIPRYFAYHILFIT